MLGRARETGTSIMAARYGGFLSIHTVMSYHVIEYIEFLTERMSFSEAIVMKSNDWRV